jgi:hypothetical protein
MIVLGVAVVLLAPAGQAEAGSTMGKTRWTFNKYEGKARRREPIKVPAARGGKPGRVELHITYRADEPAEFLVLGDGDTDVDLYVYDSGGQLVAKCEDSARNGSDLNFVTWTPRREEEFRIVILNRGPVYNLCQCGCN